MPDWMERPIHEAIYKLEQTIAQVTWGLDRSGLYVIDLIDRFRHGLVTRGFTTALDQVAETTIGVSRPVFELALTLGLLLIIASPIISLKWINLRKTILLAVCIPILLPVLAGGFQDIDGARGELATTFYTNIYSRADFDMVPPDAGGNGTTDDMGEIRDFSNERDGYTGVRGVDVAAAYLFAERGDVFNPPASLPVGFKEKYFYADVGDFDDMDADERWEQISTSADGITRTLYGIILIAFAFLEALVSLGFTLTLGFLMIAFLISLLFAYFNLFEGMTITIIKKVADLFLQSWAISAVQALILAALVKVATSGSGIATLGMGMLALGIQMLFVTVAWKAVISSVTGFGGGGGLSSYEGKAAMMAPAAMLAGGAGALAGAGMRANDQNMSDAGDHMKRGGRVALAGVAAVGGYLTGRTRNPDELAKSMGEASPESKTRTSYKTGTTGAEASTSAPAPASDDQAPNQPAESATAPRLERLGISSEIAASQPQDMEKLAQTMRRYPLPESTAQALMMDTRQRGQFSDIRRAAVIGYLGSEYGLSDERANRHADVLQRRMQRVAPGGDAPDGPGATFSPLPDQDTTAPAAATRSAPAPAPAPGRAAAATAAISTNGSAPPSWMNEPPPPTSAYTDEPPPDDEPTI